MRGSNKRREERRKKPVTIFFNTSVPASYPGQFALSELPEGAWNRARSTSLTGDATSEIAEDDWRRGYLSQLATPPTSRKPFLASKDKERKKKKEMLKCGNVRCNRVSHARQVCLTLRAKPSDWRKCWRKLSKLTNHGVYQELVTGMRTTMMLTRSTLSVSSQPHAVFAQNFLKPLSWSLEQATFAFVNQL